MSIEAEDDIEADVRAAMAEPESATHSIDVSRETVQELTSDEPTEGRVRGADGKFAKAPDVAQDAPQESAPVAPEQPNPQGDIRAPNAWTASAKAIFNDLPPLAKEEIARRELDMAKGVQKLQQQISQYAPLDEVLAPHKDELAMQGVDTVTFVRQLVAAHNALRSNPQQALQYLAQQYGGQLPQTEAPQQADPVYEKIQTLESKLAAYETAQQQAAQTELNSQIEAFQNDPANLYFDNVKPHMAALLRNGQAASLKEAYDQACWANPEVRPLLLKAEQARMANVTQLRTKTAQQAAGSVTGGAGGTVQPPQTSNSYEDDVRAAINQIGGRA